MGCWMYCDLCKSPMDVPTVVDQLVGTQACPKCGHEHGRNMDLMSRRTAIQELVDRVAELERRLYEV